MMDSRIIAQDYRAAGLWLLGRGVVAFCSASTALLLGLLFFFTAGSPPEPKTAAPVGLIFGAPLILVAVYIVGRFVQQCYLRATIDADGLTIRTLTRQTALSWESVASLGVDAPQPLHPILLIVIALFSWPLLVLYLLSRLRPRLRYSLTLTTGQTIRIPQPLTSRTLTNAIDHIVTQRLFPDAVARYESGLPCDFGAFVIDAAGIHADTYVLPWAYVRRVNREDLGVAIYSAGQHSPWAIARLKAVSNFTLFEALTATVLSRRDVRDPELAPL